MMKAPQHDIALTGCTPEPLMSYLKALGILRLVSEQKDESARGWWKNDVFWLRSTLDNDALRRLFLHEYAPTPILSPWAGGSGFFGKDNKQAVDELAGSTSARVSSYTRTIITVCELIKEEGIGDKPHDDDKVRLIQRYRRDLPDDAVAWMDAAMVLRLDGQGFAPLLGTGGNDGRLDFTQNFMQRVVSLGLHKEKRSTAEESRPWLDNALYGTAAKLDVASVGQFAPGRSGGPNATQGMEGSSHDNPWDFILMLEGTIFFSGAAGRRLGVEESRTAFPFTVRSIAAGFDSPALRDQADSRGELWLPLWTRPTSAAELRQLLGEGRADVSGRPARDGADFARAVAGMGVDRGIEEFNRFAFLKRSGKAFLATPLGRFEVTERAGTDLIRAADPWLGRFRSACSGKDVPPSLDSALRRIDSSIFAFCKYGGAPFLQEILIALGAAERTIARSERFRNAKRLTPLSGLTPRWDLAANDGSIEFAIASSLASIQDPHAKIGPFRSNVEPVDWTKHSRQWAERNRAVVWSAADLATNLAAVLERRLMDGARFGCEFLPLASRSTVPLHMLSAFIACDVIDARIEDLLWGLMLLVQDTAIRHHLRARTSGQTVPRAYALLKLLFLPRPLAIDRKADGGVTVRLLREDEPGGIVLRPEPSLLPLLRSGRIGEACGLAMRRLRASGLAPMPGRRPAGGRDFEWRELDQIGCAGIDPERLAAALLIPISDSAVNTLAHLVLRVDDVNDYEPEPSPR